MTHTLDCKIYYSMIGDSFKIYERNTDVNVWATKAIIKMNLLKMELATIGFESEEPEYETLTDIEFTHDIKGGPYFSSETQIVIVNGKNQILKLDGKSVKSEEELKTILAAHKPGDEISVEFAHRGITNLGMIKLIENPRLIVLTNEKLSLPVTEEMLSFRKTWLDTKVKN